MRPQGIPAGHTGLLGGRGREDIPRGPWETPRGALEDPKGPLALSRSPVGLHGGPRGYFGPLAQRVFPLLHWQPWPDPIILMDPYRLGDAPIDFIFRPKDV